MTYSRPVPVHELRNFAAAIQLDEATFVRQHGGALLLHEKDLGSTPKPNSDTGEMTPSKTHPGSAAPTFIVFPMGALAGYRMIRVGSGPKNHVTLDHASVAPFHAVF